MEIVFKNIFVISETIKRASTDDFFWPVETRKFKRQKLIDQNKREAWYCDFLQNGLLLDAKILIDENDYKDWPQDHKISNPNVIKSDLHFYEEFSLKSEAPILKILHRAEDAEAVRKTIYISDRFKDGADRVWAAQYFEPAASREFMKFEFGFNRALVSSDNQILADIKNDLLNFKDLKVC